jgi:DNA primase
MSFVDTIKDRINLVDLINQVGGAELHKNGAGYVGWHKAHGSESKTSLHVDPEIVAERRVLEEIFSLAVDFYHAQLPEHQREHLRLHYGLISQTIDSLKIGFAPVDKTALVSHLLAHGISGQDMAKTGLVLQWKDGSLVDFFQGRLIFPYRCGNRVVYFIGRQTEFTPAEEWEQGKYKKELVHNEKHPYVSKQVRNDFFYGEDMVCWLAE